VSHSHLPEAFLMTRQNHFDLSTRNVQTEQQQQQQYRDAESKKQPALLYTRGAYILKLSHSADLLAIACNQKYVEHTCLAFMAPLNGALTHVNLRNFGLNAQARGRLELITIYILDLIFYSAYSSLYKRHYWIQDLNWMHNDLYLAGITKHGAVFLISRLGHPMLIHATGKEINMGPALYLTLHPLIIVR